MKLVIRENTTVLGPAFSLSDLDFIIWHDLRATLALFGFTRNLKRVQGEVGQDSATDNQEKEGTEKKMMLDDDEAFISRAELSRSHWQVETQILC